MYVEKHRTLNQAELQELLAIRKLQNFGSAIWYIVRVHQFVFKNGISTDDGTHFFVVEYFKA